MSETQTTLRETLAAELEKVEANQVETTPQEVTTNETQEQKAERIRDEKGRFASAETGKTPETKTAPASVEKPIVEQSRPARPSSWKKDYWDHWDKLDPKLAEYINQREQEYAKGVSTYKNEWENAKPLMEAMAQFQPILQQYNIPPSQWITNLGNAHKQLVLGSDQERLSTFARLAQEYKVPLQGLFVQGQDGKIYLNQQLLTTQQPQPQQNIQQVVDQLLTERELTKEVERASHDKENFPHFEQVRNTMAGLLQSGLADDLKSAYEAAIRLPKHADIFEAQQQQLRQQEEAKRTGEQKKRVQTARANAISPKTATPSAQANVNGKKGLRDQLTDAFDEVVVGRV